jgi:carbamoyl-phosphate synthase small subunit
LSYGALLCESASDPDDRAGGRVWREVMLGFGVRTNDDHGIVWAYGGQSSDAAIKIGTRWFGYRIMMELVPWEIRIGTRSSLRRHLGMFDKALGSLAAMVLDKLYRMRWRKRDFGLEVSFVDRFGLPDVDTWKPASLQANAPKLVCYDFGIKRNILRNLVSAGFDPLVVPANTSAEDVLALNPHAVFLSNGPGDPAAVTSAIEAVGKLVATDLPIFGICLGHQILALALGGRTFKMKFGHHGANHPVVESSGGRIDISSQNHGFAVDSESLEGTGLEVTHLNGNDKTVAGLRHSSKPVFSVQYHPEGAPGPHDPEHLFQRFMALVAKPVAS